MRRPFQRPSIPGIRSGRLSPKIGMHEVIDKDCDRYRLNNRACGDYLVPTSPSAVCFIRVDLGGRRIIKKKMHEVKGDVEPNDHEPEVPLAQTLVEHSPGHFRIPI